MKKYLALLLAALMAVTVISSAGVVAAKKNNDGPTGAAPVWLELRDEQHTTDPIAWVYVQPLNDHAHVFKITQLTLVGGGRDLKAGQQLVLRYETKTVSNGQTVYGPDQHVAKVTVNDGSDGSTTLIPPQKTLTEKQVLAILNQNAILEVVLVQ